LYRYIRFQASQRCNRISYSLVDDKDCATSIDGIVLCWPKRFMEMPVVSNSQINSRNPLSQFPFSYVFAAKYNLIVRIVFACHKTTKLTWQKSCPIARNRKCSADRECTVCLYSKTLGISSNPIRQRRANYRESPFSDSRLFLGNPSSFPSPG